jgi:hypothetical protein
MSFFTDVTPGTPRATATVSNLDGDPIQHRMPRSIEADRTQRLRQ